jgi:hypothetical protein
MLFFSDGDTRVVDLHDGNVDQHIGVGNLFMHPQTACIAVEVTPLGDIDLNEIFPRAVEVRQAQVDVRQLRIGEQALEAGDVSQVVPRRSVP